MIFSTLTTTTKSPVSTCGVYVGGVLAHEDHGDVAGQAADDLVRGVNQPPFGRQFARLGHVGLCLACILESARFELLPRSREKKVRILLDRRPFESLPGKPAVY